MRRLSLLACVQLSDSCGERRRGFLHVVRRYASRTTTPHTASSHPESDGILEGESDDDFQTQRSKAGRPRCGRLRPRRSAGYGDRFEGSGSNGNYVLDVSGFSPSLIGTLPFGPVELFAKAGYYFYGVKLRVDLDAPGSDLRSKSSRDDLIYGGGIGMTFAEHLHVRAEYELIDLKNASSSDALWLSAPWRF